MSKDRRGSLRVLALGVVVTMPIAAALAIWWRFESDMAIAGSRAAKGSTLVTTRCGLIEYQEAGSGVPLLVYGFGTYSNAQYTASRIAGAKFIGFEEGGHVLVGHDEEMQTEIVKLLKALAEP